MGCEQAADDDLPGAEDLAGAADARLTISAKGNVVKSWVNGLPAARIGLHLRYVDVSMNVRRTSEMHHRTWAFDSPYIPNIVFA